MNKVIAFFKENNMEDKIRVFEESSATVELAAAAIGCEPRRIAKTLSFKGEDTSILIVAAGDAKIDNGRFKAQFGIKAKMLSAQEVTEYIGHSVGGVCPFVLKENVQVYLDESLRRFQTVYTACGSSNSVIELTLRELEQYTEGSIWVDVCKNWQESL